MFIGHLSIIFHEELVKSFAHFPIELFFSFLLICKNSPILERSLLVVISIADIFYCSVACCFARLMRSFNVV